MILLILTMLFSLLGAVFATQNTQVIQVNVGMYTYQGVPVYLVVLISILIGILFSCVVYYVNIFSSSLALRGRDLAIRDIKGHNTDLSKRLHQLEVENAELKAKQDDSPQDEKSL